MTRIGKTLAWALAVPAALGLAGVIVVWGASEYDLRRTYDARVETLPEPSAQMLADAPRQARVLGCFACHGPGLLGNDVYDAPAMGAITAPNLPRLSRERSDQQLEAAIRQGMGADGRGLRVMPSAVYSRLDDEQVAALIAWIRTLPAVAPAVPPLRLTFIGRLFVVNGDLPAQPDVVRLYRANLPVDRGPAHALGRHLAASNCSECHGPALGGGARSYADFNPSFGETLTPTPDLAIVAHYSLDQFKTLMRSGVPPDGRDLGEMAAVAKSDFSLFTDAEITALHGYLRARAAQ